MMSHIQARRVTVEVRICPWISQIFMEFLVKWGKPREQKGTIRMGEERA